MTETVDTLVALHGRLTPRLDALPPGLRATWVPEIRDMALRDAMMRNPRLASRILSEVQERAGIDPTSTIEPFAAAPSLLVLLDGDLSPLLRFVGLAWNAERLLRAVAAGQLQGLLPGITRDEIRAIVAYRTLSQDITAESPYAPVDVDADGALSLACWIGHLPVNVVRRLSLVADLPQALVPGPLDAPARVRLVDKVLADLAQPASP